MKNITQLSEEELLKLLTDDRNTDTDSIGNELVDFISVFNIRPGKVKVSFNQLKKVYLKWSKDKQNLKELLPFLKDHFSSVKGYFFLESSLLEVIKNKNIKFNTKKYNRMTNTKYHDHFKSFIKQYSIESGEYYVPEYLLKHFYDKWVYEKKLSKLLYLRLFNKFCCFYFKYEIIKDVFHYKINEEFILKLDKETIENVKEKHQKEKIKKR